MKSRILAALFLMGATNSLICMLELPDMKDCTKLKFLLDHENKIKTYRIKTTVKASVNNIREQDLFAMSPFAESQLKEMKSCTDQKTARAIVMLENKEFLAKMSPVFIGCGFPHKLVTLRALDNL